MSVLTLALGLGASTTFFTIASGWALRSLPFDDPDALVVLSESRPRLGRTRELVSAGSFQGWRRDGRLFQSVAVYSQVRFNVNFGRGRPERLQGARVSAELFPLLGIDPIRGRHFLPEEDRSAARRVALVSHGLWQRRFDTDPGVLGRTIPLMTLALRTRADAVGAVAPLRAELQAVDETVRAGPPRGACRPDDHAAGGVTDTLTHRPGFIRPNQGSRASTTMVASGWSRGATASPARWIETDR